MIVQKFSMGPEKKHPFSPVESCWIQETGVFMNLMATALSLAGPSSSTKASEFSVSEMDQKLFFCIPGDGG